MRSVDALSRGESVWSSCCGCAWEVKSKLSLGSSALRQVRGRSGAGGVRGRDVAGTVWPSFVALDDFQDEIVDLWYQCENSKRLKKKGCV